MPVRRLLLIDDDPEFQQLLEERLAPSGFEVVLPPDPTNPLGHVKDLRPAIIIISVELPDKIGYALCNKAKKGLARDIPVILTTRSVPASGFRSHRKLKVHADEYIDKRAMTEEEVVAKVDQLVGLIGGYGGGATAEYEDVDLDELDAVEVSDEASLARALGSLDEDEDDEDRISAVPREIAHEGGPEFDPRELGADEDDDGSFDFGEPLRLGQDLVVPLRGSTRSGTNGGRAGTVTAAGTDPGARSIVAPEPELPDMFEFEADRTAVASPFPPVHDPASARLEAAPLAAIAREGIPLDRIEPEPSAPVADLDLGLEQVASLAEEEQSDGADRLRAAELEKEVERLRAELEQARRAPPAPAGSSFSREREFLNLREVINKKEKLILDLNDQIDGKDRQILTEKERLRELERVRSDVDARNLELEQSLLGINEELADLRAERSTLGGELRKQTETLAQVRSDAEQLSRLLERERATWREERDGLIRKHTTQLEEQRHDMDSERRAAELALRDKQTSDLRTLRDAYEETSAEKDKGFGAALALAEVRRQEELSAAQRGAEERLQLELAEQRRRNQDELDALQREQAVELENLVKQNLEARQALEDRQNALIARLEEEQSQALAAAEKRRVNELADADKRRVNELADADKRRVNELADADKRRVNELAEQDERRRRELAAAGEERAQAEADLEERFEAARASMVRERQSEREELEERLSERERELGQRGEDLQAREQTIRSLHGVLSERDERLARQAQELDELERQNAGYQEQILRAFQKIKADEATVARAKKAMAIALTLLDDAEQAAVEAVAQGDE